MSQQLIPIPRTTAVAAHDDSSFLDFSPEIRNLVYAELFEVGSPIVFHYDEDESCIWYDGEIGEDENDTTTLAHMNNFSLRPKLPAATVASITGGTALLRTCRQLYWEAASVLCSNNTFLFSKSKTSHANNFGQLPMAVRFSTNIGFSLQFLRKVDIDVCHVCDTILYFPG
jgi:hypothetical protein